MEQPGTIEGRCSVFECERWRAEAFEAEEQNFRDGRWQLVASTRGMPISMGNQYLLIG